MDTKEDSSIRSEGAELWVQGHLMMEYGLLTAKASRNMPGYDILAFSPDGEKRARIQVKYRKAIDRGRNTGRGDVIRDPAVSSVSR